MTIYKALEKLLETLIPEVAGRVYHIMGTYEEAIAHIEKKRPFVTYQFDKLDTIVTMNGVTGMYDTRIEIDVFAPDVEDMARISKEIKLKLTGKHEQDGVEYILVPTGSMDAAEMEGVRRHVMYWKGNISE